MGTHPMKRYLEKQMQDVANRQKQAEADMNQAHESLLHAERLHAGGMKQNDSAKNLKWNLGQALDPRLIPGNVGDINQVVWPFWFTSSAAELDPDTTNQGQITITQEAAFILIDYQKVVYREEPGGAGQWAYIDPAQPDGAGKSNNLTFLIRDSQSSRQFMNKAIDINQIGYWKAPTVLPTPMLFLPNQNIEFTYQNNDPDLTYRVQTVFFGYRLRIDHAKDILSTISA